jgi:hypothetical protein
MKHIKLFEEYHPLPEPEFSDGIRNFYPEGEEPLKFPIVYTFITDEMKPPISMKHDGIHELCETEQELKEIRLKYKIGNIYNGGKIIDFEENSISDSYSEY